MRRRIHASANILSSDNALGICACHMRRRIHACHMRRIHLEL
jgi:hypothetical protein